jgi:hypothetical protein
MILDMGKPRDELIHDYRDDLNRAVSEGMPPRLTSSSFARGIFEKSQILLFAGDLGQRSPGQLDEASLDAYFSGSVALAA